MTATYALDLTAMSADLFCRRNGGWVSVGSIPLPETELGDRLLGLLAAAGAEQGTPIAVALPPEEVVVLTTPPAAGDPAARARAAMLLERRLDPDTLRLDWSEQPEGGLAIAAVRLATLDEAQHFLRVLGLEPAGCGARFGTVPFAAGAWFGIADGAAGPDGRAPRPDFLPLPWTTHPNAVPEGVASDAIDALPAETDAVPGPSASDAEAAAPVAVDAGAGAAHSPVPGPVPPTLGSHEGAYQAARARALAIARRSPLALAPLSDGPEGDPVPAAPRRALAPRTPQPPRDRPKRSPEFARQSRRGAVLSLCLAAGLAAAAFLPEIGLPWSSSEDPGPDWEAGTEQDAAVWLGTGAEEAAEVILDADSDDPEILLASFVPAAVYSPPATPASMAALAYPGLDRVFRTDALTLTDRARKPGSTGPQVGLTKPSVPHETFAYDDKGLIRPTRSGTLSPEGFKVYAGKPPGKVVPRPERSEAVPPVIILTGETTAADAADNPLRKGDPKPRPAGLSERFERARLGGKTEKELAAAAPRHRPVSAQETAVASAPAAAPSAYAVAATPRPAVRTDEARSAFEVASAAPLVIPAALAPLAVAPATAPVAAPPKAPARTAVAAAPARPVAPQKPASVKAAAAAKPAAAAPKPAAPAAAPAAPKTQVVAVRPSQEPAAKTRTASKAAPAPAQPKAVVAEVPAKTRAQPARTQPAPAKQAQPAATRTAAAPAAPAKTTAAAQPAQTRTQAASPSRTVPKTQPGVTLVASAASGSSPKQVQERATTGDMLDLSELNLLGTFGSNADARAIVRMPNGKVVNVAVGDKLDGGRVAAIGDGQLNYVKRGKTHTLQMPQG